MNLLALLRDLWRLAGPASVAATTPGCAPTPPPAAAGTPAQPERPIALIDVSLDTAAPPNAEPGDWVQCSGGTFTTHTPTGPHQEPVCSEGVQAWVDATRDLITLVVQAENADTLVAPGAERRFLDVDGPPTARARISLWQLAARLPATEVLPVTTLTLPFTVHAETTRAEGRLELVTPRILKALASGQPLSAATRTDALPPAADAPLLLIEESQSGELAVRSAPKVPLADLGWVAVLRPVPDSVARRLTLYAQPAGTVAGEHTYTQADPTVEALLEDARRLSAVHRTD